MKDDEDNYDPGQRNDEVYPPQTRYYDSQTTNEVQPLINNYGEATIVGEAPPFFEEKENALPVKSALEEAEPTAPEDPDNYKTVQTPNATLPPPIGFKSEVTGSENGEIAPASTVLLEEVSRPIVLTEETAQSIKTSAGDDANRDEEPQSKLVEPTAPDEESAHPPSSVQQTIG